MSPRADKDAVPKLDPYVQRALGEGLRQSYAYLTRGIPERFVELFRRMREAEEKAKSDLLLKPRSLAPEGESGKDAFVGAADTPYFDPQSLAVLNAALEEAWTTLQAIGNSSITREALAHRIVDLARKGERDRGRLASRSVVGLIAPQTRPAD